MRYRRESFSIEAGIKKGRPLPHWFNDLPEVRDGDEFFMRSFWLLSTERAIGGSAVGPIPWSAIVRFASFSGLEREMVGPFVQIIRALDAAYLGDLAGEHARAMRREQGQPQESAKKEAP